MELAELEQIKKTVSEMIKTKKSLDKAIESSFNSDSFANSRAKATTLEANIGKRHKLLDDELKWLKKMVNKLF